VFLPCFGLWKRLACRGRLGLFVVRLGYLGRLSPCRGYLAGSNAVAGRGLRPVGVVGVVGLFMCVIAWLSISPSVAGSHPVAVCVFRPFKLSRFGSPCISRGGAVCRTGVRNKCSTIFGCASGDMSICPTESDRILEPNRTESQPNPDRILPQSSTESLIGLLPRLALHDR